MTVAAPAKVNLFLHVTGRRDDGYHDIESLFVFVDLADTLSITLREDGAIVRANEVAGVRVEEDLAIRAARTLKEASGVGAGATIALEKRIPLGAGLGGGSSDAASVLLALNRLWKLEWSRARLSALSRTLGADVAFFVGGEHAIGRGIGEVLTPVTLPTMWLALVHPEARVDTARIFTAPELTRDTPSAKIDVFSEGYGHNDLARATTARFPRVAETLAALQAHAPKARMTGSGACVFAAFPSERDARDALSALTMPVQRHVVRTLARHPLAEFAR
jgi:4-diphosphocytidyl-2-C-methyl-D-erythritol kinase